MNIVIIHQVNSEIHHEMILFHNFEGLGNIP